MIIRYILRYTGSFSLYCPPREDARLFILSGELTEGRNWFGLTIAHKGDTVSVWSSFILELRKSKIALILQGATTFESCYDSCAGTIPENFLVNEFLILR